MSSTKKLSRHAMVGIFVIGVHVLMAIGLVIGTAIKYAPQLTEMIESKLIQHEQEDKPKEPPPPPPDFKPPPVQTPLVDLPIVQGPPPPAAIVRPVEQPKPEPAAKPAPPPISPVRIVKGVNLGDRCEAYYPSASRRLSEEGSVVLLVFVSPDGKATETKVETSSGIQRLDEAAEKCIKAQGKIFEPQKVGNEAVGTWQRMKWTWRLSS
ncbi:MAG: TonB family protein [Proteobacteria bacterium]|nr:TonB family protein [Pseudomonadota bacterium]